MQSVNPFDAIYAKINNPSNNRYSFDFPVCIDVELCNVCNINCYMCPTGIGASIREKGFMADSTFYKLLQDISGHKIGLRFIRWGEPTLHPKLCDYIKSAKIEGHLCHINTNGMLIDRFIDDLLEIGLDSIKFSFQGVSPESYSRMRKSGDFNTVVANIKKLHSKRIGITPFIQVSTTTTNETEDEINAFIKNVTPYCDKVNVGATMLEHLDVDRAKLSESQKQFFMDLKKSQKVQKRRLLCCTEVFGKLSIDWDGKVTACCSDYDRELIIGDINKSSIMQIFNNDIINKYRTILEKNAYSKIPKCDKCYDYMLIQA